MGFFKKMEDSKDMSSEALQIGLKPSKAIEDMTEEERLEFIHSINPDEMGFLGVQEGAPNEEY